MVEKIIHFARFMMGRERLMHAILVRDFALKLSHVHGLDPFKMELMALSHDLFRDVPPHKLLKIAKVWNIEVEDVELKNPVLLHGKVAAEFLKRRFDYDDEKVLLAIAYHTSGHPALDLHGKALVISDTLSMDRNFDGLEDLRKIAFKDLEMAFKEVLRNRINYAIKTDRFLLPKSVQTWNTIVG